MKKLIYIIVGLVFVAVTSCQKEVIQPNYGNNSSFLDSQKTAIDVIPTPTSTSSTNTQETSTSSGSVITGGGTTDDGSITDPNNDPDKAKKKGK